MNPDAFSLSASMPFSASDGEKVAQPDEVSLESGERDGVRCRNSAIQSAQTAGYSDCLAADEAAADYIATRIAPRLRVSVDVIAKRLRVGKLWPPV